MSRFDEYNNEFDEEDDGEDLEITDDDEAASDDEGREQAALLMAHCESIVGNRRVHEDQRRMWFRMAKQALAEGAERRTAIEAAEKARVVAEGNAERVRIAREAKEERHRERFERSMRESDERWERLNEQTRRENAAWEADRPARERREREAAAAARPAAPVRAPGCEGRPVQRPLATTSPSNATSARPIDKPASSATFPTLPSAPRSAGVPAQSGSALRRQTTRQPSVQIAPQQPHGREPDDRIMAPPRARPSPASAPAATAPVRRPPPTLPARVTPRTPTTPPPASRALTSPPPTAMLTGADLAAWRAARGLTQRPAADLLGVAPSTVAKAELLPAKVLGEQLQVALATALRR